MIIPDALVLRPVLMDIAAELRLRTEFHHDYLRCLATNVCIRALRLRADKASGERRLSPAQRQAILEMVETAGATGLTPADLADAAELSQRYFAQLFKQTFGNTPREWLVAERMREAADLLMSSTMPVYQVAEALGYCDVSQFSRQFHRIIGQAPGHFRLGKQK